jgi:hypothetical protein
MRCEHKPVWVDEVAVSACGDCQRVDWFGADGKVDAAEAVAALFGSFDLIGPMEALGAPSSRVLAYKAPNSRKRRNLDALPKGMWLKVGPYLWLAHDGQVLLLATTQPLMFENLTRGA